MSAALTWWCHPVELKGDGSDLTKQSSAILQMRMQKRWKRDHPWFLFLFFVLFLFQILWLLLDSLGTTSMMSRIQLMMIDRNIKDRQSDDGCVSHYATTFFFVDYNWMIYLIGKKESPTPRNRRKTINEKPFGCFLVATNGVNIPLFNRMMVIISREQQPEPGLTTRLRISSQ